ncbi:hypothetical protein [Polymorphospora sp. NPDC050346]
MSLLWTVDPAKNTELSVAVFAGLPVRTGRGNTGGRHTTLPDTH